MSAAKWPNSVVVRENGCIATFDLQDDGSLWVEVEHNNHPYRDTCCPISLTVDQDGVRFLADLISERRLAL